MSGGFSLTHVNSIPQFPPTYHNAPAQTSQINFQQQQQHQQQQQQSTNQQQPMQCQQYYCYPGNQQAGGMVSQNQYVQPYQQDPYVVGQQQQHQHQQHPIQRSGPGNLGQPLGNAPFNVPSIMQPQAIGYGSLPAYVLADQARTYFGGAPGPIFILPNNCPNPSNQVTQQVVPSNPSVGQGCPGIGINCPASINHGCTGSSCFPYPVPMPMYNPYFQASSPHTTRDTKNCGCCPRKISTQDSSNANAMNWSSLRYPNVMIDEHRCSITTDETICSQKNCPSAINLQALASQLLAIPGIVSCASTRLILRKIPGSEITTSTEETIERAKRSLMSLTKDQLLSETRAAHQINALINLHMTANPPMNVIPVLTSLQLKVNLLKAQVDALLNRRLSENQGFGMAEANLDPVILATKTDQELRDLLATLRQKECDERVNYNFAPYKSQRVIAESRLTNVQNKIAQIEEEMDRRRAALLPGSSIVAERRVSQQSSDPGCTAWYGYPGDVNNNDWNTQNYRSPDPFRAVQVRNPKRLNLKPHVGSPETTYENPVKTSCFRASSRSTRMANNEDNDEAEIDKKRETSDERPCCNCDKSSDDDSHDEGKKKRGVKIHGTKEIVSSRREGGVSIVKLSPHVTIVIDETGNATRDDYHRHDRGANRKTQNTIEDEPRENSFEAPDPSAPGEDDVESVTKEDQTKPPGRIEGTSTSGSRDENNFVSPEQDVNRMESSVHKMEYDVDKMAAAVDKMKDVNRGEENIPTVETSTEGTELSLQTKPEPLREETVRMITKIHYEPSVFRGFRDNDETIVEERYKARPFTEDSSLKSTSTESNVTGNLNTNAVSLHPESCEVSLDVTTQREKSLKNLEKLPEKEPRSDRLEGRENSEESDEKRIRSSTKIDVLVKSDDATNNGGRENETRNELISGALSTIGNHVASFGSLIGKIATLKLHRSDETSHEMFPESEKPSPDDEAIATGSRDTTGNSQDTRREIGRWRYIRFSDVPESTNTSVGDIHHDPTYTLPRLKHSVIEDKSTGGKYVVTETTTTTPGQSNDHRLGRPYKTGRSLVIRSRPKSPATAGEQSGPFAVVPVTRRRRDKNCIALSLADVRALTKNRTKPPPKEIKPSDKFWLKPETPARIKQSIKSPDVARSKKSRSIENSTNDSCAIPAHTSTDEDIVKVHEYSIIHVDP